MERLDAPYRKYSTYLKQRHGAPVYRVAVDAGFSCPNRGPRREEGGCTYCDSRGSRAVYQEQCYRSPSDTSGLEYVRQQVVGGIRFLQKRYHVDHFSLYFQAFSGTYAPIDVLSRLYDFCLSLAPFKELIVSTRPDCLSAEVIELLTTYKKRGLDVWVELGLQSSHDRTLERINRGHTVEDFFCAFSELRRAGVLIAPHVIFGLPGEGEREILETITYLARLQPDGIKIHNLHIPLDTPLYKEYLLGEISIPCAERHLEYSVKALERLPPTTVIMRFLCDTPTEFLAAPKRFWSKSYFYKKISEQMVGQNTWQGRVYADSSSYL